MRPDAVRAASPVGSRKTFHLFRIASVDGIAGAQARYDALVDAGEIHPAAHAMLIAGKGYRVALSPPQGSHRSS